MKISMHIYIFSSVSCFICQSLSLSTIFCSEKTVGPYFIVFFSPFYNNNYLLHILDAEDYCSTESTKHFSPYFTRKGPNAIKLFTP